MDGLVKMGRWRYAIWLLTGVSAGIGWQYLWLLPLAVVVPVIWSWGRYRSEALIPVSAYYLTATFPIIEGVKTFFDTSILNATMIWGALNVIHIFPWFVGWSSQWKWRQVAIVIILMISALPPLAAFLVAHPIQLSGLFFPGQGLVGGIALIGLIVSISMQPKLVIVPLSLCVAYLMAGVPKAPVLEGIHVVNTDHKHDESSIGVIEYLGRQIELAGKVRRGVNLFPESAMGNITEDTIPVWQQNIPHESLVIVGGTIIDEASGIKKNVLLEVSRHTSRVIYGQRMPPPLSMWAPWRKDSYASDWFGSSIISIGGRSAVPLMCYEQLLVWPVLQASLEGFDMIYAPGNLAYARGTSIPEMQENAAQLWGLLFGVPVAVAFNR